jgi:hypothetical protein
MMEGEEMVDCSVLGVGRKSAEKWCFNIEGKINSAEQWCCSIGRGKAKQLLDGVVLSMMDDEEMKKVSSRGGGKKCEFGVSVIEKKGGLLTVVFRQKVESGEWWLFASEASQEG